MNKRPLVLRTAIVIVVMLVFCAAMYPLVPPDYYDAFVSLLKDKTSTTQGRPHLFRASM